MPTRKLGWLILMLPMKYTELRGKQIVVWLLKMLVKGPNKIILNTGSDHALSIKDAAEIISKLRPFGIPVACSDKSPRHRLRYVPSIEAAKEALHLDIWTDYETSVRKTLQWYENSLSNQ